MSEDSADTAAQLAARDDQIAALQREVNINRVSRLTGVPPEFLSGTTEDELFTSAQNALEWQAEREEAISQSMPQTAAVPASVVTSADRIEMPHQVTTQDELRRLTPAQRMQAYREGRLIHLGANPPGPRRIGLSGAPTDQV